MSKSDFKRLMKKADDVAELLSAMANPKRLMILCHLSTQERTVNQLVEALDITQSAVSQHLTRMRNLRLVRARRSGQQVFYSIASSEVMTIMRTLYKTYCAQ